MNAFLNFHENDVFHERFGVVPKSFDEYQDAAHSFRLF